MTTRIGRARQALRDALVGGALSKDRAHLFPQTGQYPLPCGWVGLPTITTDRSGISLSVPVVLLFDGSADQQMSTMDDEVSRAWDALRSVRLDGRKANVTRAAPDTFGPDGGTVLGTVLTVSLELATLTLCDGQPLVDPA